jgi:Ca2+-transporting ATPase
LRYIRYQMAGLFGFIATFLGASIFFIAEGVPFLPLQTLWINFTVTVFLAVGLGYGSARAGLMQDKPRDQKLPILPSKLLSWVVVAGIVMGVSTLAIIAWASNQYGEAVGRTMGLTAFSLANVWFAMETADEDHSIFAADIMSNKTLVKTIIASLVVIVLSTELGILNRILDTVSLTLNQWVICIGASLTVLVLAEIRKLLGIHVTEESVAAAPVAAAPVPAQAA